MIIPILNVPATASEGASSSPCLCRIAVSGLTVTPTEGHAAAAGRAGAQVNDAMAQHGDDVLYEVLPGRVALITLNRPDRLNALTMQMQEMYFDALERADADPEVSIIVVTGVGRGFCAGADVELLKTIGGKGTEGMKHDRNVDQILAYSITKPIIAAVNGACAGLGFVLAVMADIRFSTETAKFTSAFAKRGLIAEHGISWALPRIVGISNAMDILMSARIVPGAEAKSMGLVTAVYPDAETLRKEVIEYARQMAIHCSPASLAEIKAQVYHHASATPREAFDESSSLMLKSFKHPDSKEGVDSYNENREPVWQGLKFGRIAKL